MNINQLKDECNGLFERAINMLEKYADPNEICKLLLEAASLLVEIGKNSPSDKAKCDSKAKMEPFFPLNPKNRFRLMQLSIF